METHLQVWGCLVAEMFGCRFDLRILMISGMSNNIEATFSHAWAGLNAIDSVIVVSSALIADAAPLIAAVLSWINDKLNHI